MAALLADFGLIVTAVVAWINSIAGAITSNPIVLVPFAIPIIGAGVGFLLRLARPN